MTDLLVRLFIKNRDNTSDSAVRGAYGILASIVGIICNIMLCICKMLIGMLSGSMAIISDGFNNLSDAASSIIGLVGIKLSQKPADDDHPFGHGRYEYIAALIVAFLILEVGISCFKSSFDKIRNPEDITFSTVSVIVLVLSILVKLWLSFFNRRLGHRIDSKVMEATAKDAIGDVFVTSATVISLIVIRFTSLNIDGYVGCAVSVMVLIAGFNVARDTIEPILGEAVPAELCNKISSFVESYKGVEGTHDLIVHSYGPSKRMASIHVEVRNDIDFNYAHELVDRIERDMIHTNGIFLVIHTDPIDVSENVLKYRNVVSEIVTSVDSRASIHDFRMVSGQSRTNLIFDLVAPFEYKDDKKEALVAEVSRKVTEYDSRFFCVITVENSFVRQ